MSSQKNIFGEWFYWHFVEMPKFLVQVWKNYLAFASDYFSAPLLLKTFFAPWKKYNWKYPRGFDILEISNTFVSNIFSRILGAMMRSVLIIFGIFFQIFVIITGLVIILFWMLMPFLIIFGFIYLLYV